MPTVSSIVSQTAQTVRIAPAKSGPTKPGQTITNPGPHGLGTETVTLPTLDDTYYQLVDCVHSACQHKLRWGSQEHWGSSKKATLHYVAKELKTRGGTGHPIYKQHLKNWSALLKSGRIRQMFSGWDGTFYLPDFLTVLVDGEWEADVPLARQFAAATLPVQFAKQLREGGAQA